MLLAAGLEPVASSRDEERAPFFFLKRVVFTNTNSSDITYVSDFAQLPQEERLYTTVFIYEIGPPKICKLTLMGKTSGVPL